MNPNRVGDVLSGLTLTFVMLDGSKVNQKYERTYLYPLKRDMLFVNVVRLA